MDLGTGSVLRKQACLWTHVFLEDVKGESFNAPMDPGSRSEIVKELSVKGKTCHQ